MPGQELRDFVNAAIAQLGESPTARRDAELLMMRAVGRDRAWVLTHADAELTAKQNSEFESWVERRARHEPVQVVRQLLGLQARARELGDKIHKLPGFQESLHLLP